MEERHNQFNVGDQVVFKTWEELKAEYGMDPEYSNIINCNKKFTDSMEENIDRSRTYTIASFEGDSVTFTESPSDYNFIYSEDMIKLAVDVVPEVDPTFYTWEFQIPQRTKDELHLIVTADVGIGRAKANKGYEGLLTALCMGTGKRICIDYGRHLGISPTDIFNYCESRSNYTNFCMIEYGCMEEIEIYDQWAVDNEVVKMKICESYAYLKNGVAIVLVDKKETIYTDDFAFGLMALMHDFWDIDSNNELYSYILERNYDAAKSKIDNFIYLAIDAKKRKEFDKQVDYLTKQMGKNVLIRYEKNIETKTDLVRRMERELRTAYAELREAQKSKMYYEFVSQDREEDELIVLIKADYENVTRIDASREGRIRISFKQPLLFFEDDDWTSMRTNYMKEFSSKKYLLDALFTRRAQVIFEQAISIDLRDNKVSHYSDWSCSVGIPNPHIQEYNCWGDNRPNIECALAEFNYDVAYSTIKSAIAGLNLVDNPVMGKFCRYITNGYYDDINCIVDLETGKQMTIPEAENFYKAKEEKSAS